MTTPAELIAAVTETEGYRKLRAHFLVIDCLQRELGGRGTALINLMSKEIGEAAQEMEATQAFKDLVDHHGDKPVPRTAAYKDLSELSA